MTADARAMYAAMPKEAVACDLCGSRDFEPVAEQDRYGMGISTVLCRRCGFVFLNPRPTREAMVRFYRDHYRQYYFGHPDPRDPKYLESEYRTTALARGRWLLDFVKPAVAERRPTGAPCVLEIGCGEGAFLEAARQEWPGSRLFGCEPSPFYAAFAAERSGAKVVAQDADTFLEQHAELAGQCDVVVLSHVLEHLYDPRAKLVQLARFLSPRGVLCIEVPDFLSPYYTYGLGALHIGHCNQFTEPTLRLAARLSGLDCLRAFHDKHPVDEWAMTFLFSVSGSPLDRTQTPALTADEVRALAAQIQRQVFGTAVNDAPAARPLEPAPTSAVTTPPRRLSWIPARLRRFLCADRK